VIFDLSKWRRAPTRAASDAALDGDIVYAVDESGAAILRHRLSPVAAGHSISLGASGCGKSVREASYLARAIAYEYAHVPPPDRLSVTVVDAKGDLVELLLQALCAELAPEHLKEAMENTGIIDPFSRDPQTIAPLNFVHATWGDQPVGIVALMLGSIIGSASVASSATQRVHMGSRQTELLAMVILACLTTGIAEASLLWGLESLQNDRLKDLARLSTSRRAREYLENIDVSAELLSSTAARLRTLALYEELETSIGVPGLCLNATELTRPGRITLCDLGNAPLPGLAEVLGSTIVQMIGQTLLARPNATVARLPPALLAIDEVQVVASAIEEIGVRFLTVGRSKSIACTILSQSTQLLQNRAPELLAAFGTNAALRSVARMSVPDCEQWVRGVAPQPGVSESLGTIRSRLLSQVATLQNQEFFYFDTAAGVRTRARSLHVDLDLWRAAAEQHKDLIAAARRRWTPQQGGLQPPVTLSDYLKQQRASAPPRNPPSKPRSKWG
jgi:hypothetical protein